MGKLKSTDIYRASVPALRPWAASNGFVGPADPRSPGTWNGSWAGIAVAFDLQVDKSGWNDREGSHFTINFEARFPAAAHRTRFAELLRRRESPEELAMAWSTNHEPAYMDADRRAFAGLAQRVRTKLPGPDEFPDLNMSLEDFITDPWMRYWDVGDVTEWLSTFVVPRLPRMLDALVLGEPKPMAMPKHALASLTVTVDGGRVFLRLSEPDARRLREGLRVPWKEVTIEGPTHSVVLAQTSAVRGPIGKVAESVLELTWRLGKSTRGALIELLETAPIGRPLPVEDRAGSMRFDTGVTLEVHA